MQGSLLGSRQRIWICNFCKDLLKSVKIYIVLLLENNHSMRVFVPKHILSSTGCKDNLNDLSFDLSVANWLFHFQTSHYYSYIIQLLYKVLSHNQRNITSCRHCCENTSLYSVSTLSLTLKISGYWPPVFMVPSSDSLLWLRPGLGIF